MSREYVVLSKKVRPKFKAKLIYDDSPQNPRECSEPTTRIHLWGDRHSDLPSSEEIRSYEEAIHELYKKVYPELIDRCLDDEPPPEVLELIERTEYPGVALWLTRHGGYETHLAASHHVDASDRNMAGVAFIGDEGLAEQGLSRQDGETMLRNELLSLEQYINGNIFLLRVTVDGDTQHYGEIYPLAQSEETTGRIHPLINCHTPPESLLDEILLDAAPSEEDRALIAAKKWK